MNRAWQRRGWRVAGMAVVVVCLALSGGTIARARAWSPASWSAAAAGAGDAAGSAARISSGGEETVLRLAGARRQPAPIPTPRGPLLRRLRPNTVSLGFQGQYGGIRGNSRLADGFDHGPGYAFRFRYMVSTRAALGFSFEHQRFGSVQPPRNVPGQPADSHVVVTTISVESVLYSHRERETHPYFVLGAGYASPDVITAEQQVDRVNEGGFLVGGIGFERFIRERFSVDGCLRVYGHIANSEFSSIGQVSLGIHLYPGD